MKREEYMKYYRQYYKTKKSIVTFAIDNNEFDKLKKFALSKDMSVNSLAKEILSHFVDTTKNISLSIQQEEIIKDYIRVNRGIANNINQIAFKTNIGEYIDINILLKSLKDNEDKFKALIQKFDI